jgi:hypothetical protein
MAGGRPTTYSDDVADKMCDMIAEGWSVRQICMQDGMPEQATFYRWLLNQPWLQDKYARAKEAQMDHFNEEIIDIADDGSNDWIERERQNGSTFVALNEEALGRARLRIDTRKWLMAKHKPRKYGEKLAVGGADDLPPVAMQQTINVAVLSLEQLEALQAALVGSGRLIDHDGNVSRETESDD